MMLPGGSRDRPAPNTAVAALPDRLAFTINNGYANPAARTSYGQWKSVLAPRALVVADQENRTDVRH
jgi:hypothetical protein